ncbi:MAG: rhomboid family intramembrane serine protease [Anaerolineae bacterium]|nr:MAG: rhomboid family intramembrane serine protease [Anaerolineae bacterium]
MFPLRDTIPSRRFPLVNWLLIAANVVAFVFESSLSPRQLTHFIRLFGVVPAHISLFAPATWFSMLSSMFLHGSWFHLLSNMWALYIFGDNVEDRMGHGRYLGFYLLSGVAAALLQVWMMPASRVPIVGASGAIAGVLGAYVVLFPRARVVTLVTLFFFLSFVEIPALLYLGFWFISQLFSGLASLAAPGLVSGVAWWAHVGGFLFGIFGVHAFTEKQPAYYRWYPDEYWPW